MTYSQIPSRLSRLLSELAAEDHLRGLDFEQMIDRSAHYLAELNYIHPFREGNGRATREFMRLLYAANGYEVNWGAVSPVEFLEAMETSIFDTDMLKAVLAKCLKRISAT